MESKSEKTISPAELDELCINTLRMLAVDMVEKAASGHPGMPLGAAPMAYVLWSRFLRHNPANPAWPDRDRFVLSAGHGSALLYALLHLSGYALSMEDLQSFRQWGSRTPGHPERSEVPGVEVTTGPLGQGFANAVGLAMAERFLAARFNCPNFDVVDHHTYVLASDGDLMEGIASEAASLAGHLQLGKLICLYDDNHISLAGSTGVTFTEDVGGRFAAYGWQVQQVEDGNDLAALDRAIKIARQETQRPSLIRVRTHIGFGSPHKQDTFAAHGSPLGTEEAAATKKNLGWPPEPAFIVPEPAREHMRRALERGREEETAWHSLLAAYGENYPERIREWQRIQAGELPEGWQQDIPAFTVEQKPMATRAAGGEILNAIAKRVGNLLGGSADLDPSTKTALKNRGSFHPATAGDDKLQGSPKGPWDFASPNIAFGVREHAMGGILNGLAAHGGLIPYGSTFFIFSDYMRPAMRLAALSRLKVIYVFTHDSVALGEDGPTHQPVEQLAGFRAMPNMLVLRPADANETAESWKVALAHQGGPVMLVLSRQNLPVLDRRRGAPAAGVQQGAYVLADPPREKPEMILLATGSEVPLALQAQEALGKLHIPVRVVSMPCWELFELQPASYRDSVLPPALTARLSIEAAATFGWRRYVGDAGRCLGIDHFGASAPGEVNQQQFGFTVEKIVALAKEVLGR